MRLEAPLDDLFSNRSHVRVLRALHRLPRGFAASGRELARRAGIAHPTALRALALLVNIGVVMTDRGLGRDAYALNHDHLLAAHLATLFGAEAAIGEELVSFLRESLRVVGPKVQKATLFGSAVWGESTPDSDIDVAVSCSREDLDEVESALRELGEVVHRRYGNRLSPLVYSRARSRKSGIWKRIDRDGIPLIRSGKPVTT